MNEVSRFLVDKKPIEKNGEAFYRLYFYDSMDNVVITIDAPVRRTNRLPVMAEQYPELEVVKKPEPRKIVILVDEEEDE